jgi:hypothetical protein
VEGKSIRTCMVTVGVRDERAAIQLLTDHKMVGLSFIPASLRRTNKREYEKRLLVHDLVVKQTTGVKVESLEFEKIPEFRTKMMESKQGGVIIDVAETNHARDTGVVYVQCLKASVEAVKQEIQLQFTDFPGAVMPEQDGSVARTTNTRHESRSTTTTLPPNKYMAALIGTAITTTTPTATVPKPAPPIPDTISVVPEQKKSFSDKFMEELQKAGEDSDTESSEEDTIKTGGSTLQTNKTAREVELEELNDELVEKNDKLKATNNTLTADVAYLKSQMATMEVRMKKTMMKEMNETMMKEMKKMIQDSKKEESSGAAHSPDRTPQASSKRTKLDEKGATGIVSNLSDAFGLTNAFPPSFEAAAENSVMEEPIN